MSISAIDNIDVSVLQLYNLPILESFMKRLAIRDHIDSLCPSRSNAIITHGQVVECLVANRLSAPRPLYDIQNWAATLAVNEVFGVDPDDLNDDRIGRALDAIAESIESLQGSIVASAMLEFGLDAKSIHWDLTSLFFAGEYPEEEQSSDHPIITYGYSSQKFTDKKQVRMGYGVTSDGSIPIWQKVFDGSQSDATTVAKTLRSLIKHAKLSDFLMIGDSKLLSDSNILAFIESKLKFLAPRSSSSALDKEFLSIPKDQFHPLSYVSDEQLRLPEEQRNTYVGCERTTTITDHKSHRSYVLRRLFVISSEERDARRKNRARQMAKAAKDLDTLTRTAGGRHYPTADDVETKAREILKSRRVGKWFVYAVKDRYGIPSFSYSINQEALKATEELDGFYVLETNLSIDEADSSEILRRYKGQYRVERRFKESKQALKVRPLFLSSNKRIESLVFVIGIALMIFSLIEREARRNLPNPKDKIPNLLAGHVAARPTGENIFRAFAYFHAVVLYCDGERRVKIPPLDPVQATLLRLLGIREIRYG
jgi:transposase